MLREVCASEAAQHFVLREVEPKRHQELVDHIVSLWGVSTSEVVCCDLCNFVFANPYVAGDGIFYNLAFEKPQYPKWRWEFQKTLDCLRSDSDRELSLLEIGAGDGAFLVRFVEDFANSRNVTALEYANDAIEKCKRIGVNCLGVDVRQLKDEHYADSFDVICMFQVLEHMDGVDLLFLQLGRLLKKGGRIFISVPNSNRIEFNEKYGGLLDMPPNHIGRWSRTAFEVIGARYGFLIDSFVVEDFDIGSALRQLASYRFLRKSQNAGSIENRVARLKKGAFRSFAIGLLSLTSLLLALPAVRKLDRSLGGSVWVCLRKPLGQHMRT